MRSASSTMGAAGRAGEGTSLTHDTATNNEEEKPWADNRHFSIISFYVVVVAILATPAFSDMEFRSSYCSASSPISRSFSPCLYY